MSEIDKCDCKKCIYLWENECWYFMNIAEYSESKYIEDEKINVYTFKRYPLRSPQIININNDCVWFEDEQNG